MASFGGDTIDAYRVIRNVPALSMLTGLLANAIGWTRTMRREHENLQNHIRFAAAWDEPPGSRIFTDYQTAQLEKKNSAWTTRGVPAVRKGGTGTYMGSHQRWLEYHADVKITLVLTVTDQEGLPTPEHLAAALQRPARPLFLGRKTCLPAAPIYRGILNGYLDAVAALRVAVPEGSTNLVAYWPENEGAVHGIRRLRMVDKRNWWTRIHGGDGIICEGRIDSLSLDL